MARARSLKPSLFKNEILGEADPLLTLLFEGLWCLADREGRLEDRPKRIKAEIFPYREITSINGYLTDLERLGFIVRYEVENQPIIQVINFLKHQSPHKTEKPSELPAPPAESIGCALTVKAPLSNGHDHVKESPLTDSLLLTPEKKDHVHQAADESFPRWWAQYPRKEAKPHAEKAWRRLNAADRAAALDALDGWPFPEDKKFIPLPASWLNARRWEDEREEADSWMPS